MIANVRTFTSILLVLQVLNSKVCFECSLHQCVFCLKFFQSGFIGFDQEFSWFLTILYSIVSRLHPHALTYWFLGRSAHPPPCSFIRELLISPYSHLSIFRAPPSPLTYWFSRPCPHKNHQCAEHGGSETEIRAREQSVKSPLPSVDSRIKNRFLERLNKSLQDLGQKYKHTEYNRDS